MTATGSKQTATDRKKMAGQILFVVALLIVARLLWARTQPEHLANLWLDRFKISAEQIYMFGRVNRALQERPNNSINVQSIYSPARRTLVENDRTYKLCQQDTPNIVDGNLYYALEPYSRGHFESPLPPAPPDSQGTFLLQPTTTGQTRTKLAEPPPPAREVRFLRLSLRGGEPREVTSRPLNTLPIF